MPSLSCGLSRRRSGAAQALFGVFVRYASRYPNPRHSSVHTTFHRTRLRTSYPNTSWTFAVVRRPTTFQGPKMPHPIPAAWLMRMTGGRLKVIRRIATGKTAPARYRTPSPVNASSLSAYENGPNPAIMGRVPPR